jgi:hypothetical protein
LVEYEKNSLIRYWKKQGNTGTKKRTGGTKYSETHPGHFWDPLSGEYKLTNVHNNTVLTPHEDGNSVLHRKGQKNVFHIMQHHLP